MPNPQDMPPRPHRDEGMNSLDTDIVMIREEDTQPGGPPRESFLKWLEKKYGRRPGTPPSKPPEPEPTEVTGLPTRPARSGVCSRT